MKGLVQAEGDSVVTPQKETLLGMICSEFRRKLIYTLEIPGHVEMQE